MARVVAGPDVLRIEDVDIAAGSPRCDQLDDDIMPVFCPTRQIDFVKSAAVASGS
ncbi:hypothetical protein [Bradyrhizobium sp. SSUT77]|uniref:hypothetical protein n=1 Tax=Bradyrhizobium sp. SSUT77 TaxID=3040603 RepID=UPI0024499250|nr:hypothetical protein [Bradyrhizobium sp. SSUT77]MDH2346701.1 hypothetical protein [Bradyrhizobium sp. SSUT77]